MTRSHEFADGIGATGGAGGVEVAPATNQARKSPRSRGKEAREA